MLHSAERGHNKVVILIKPDGGEPADSGSPPHNIANYAKKIHTYILCSCGCPALMCFTQTKYSCDLVRMFRQYSSQAFFLRPNCCGRNTLPYRTTFPDRTNQNMTAEDHASQIQDTARCPLHKGSGKLISWNILRITSMYFSSPLHSLYSVL